MPKSRIRRSFRIFRFGHIFVNSLLVIDLVAFQKEDMKIS
jgi:hypothetical protein